MIRLQRTVDVATYDTEGTVAIGKDRPEWLAVARLAADFGRPITGRDVVQELLGKLPEHVGWLVIDRCVYLGLLQRDGVRGPAALTDSGRVALERGVVLEPQEGAWRFFYVSDPLVEDALVHVARLSTDNAQNERNQLHGQKNTEHGTIPPSELQDAAGSEYVWASIANGDSFEVRTIAQQGAPGPKTQLRLYLDWIRGEEPMVTLRGRLSLPQALKKHDRDSDEPRHADVDRALSQPYVLNGCTYDAVWRDLVTRATGIDTDELQQWHHTAAKLVVPVRFDDLSSEARRKHTMTLQVTRPTFKPLGRFEDTELKNVALVPSTQDDANDWAAWLQWDEIRSYMLPADIANIAVRIQGLFPYHQIQFPGANELLDRARDEPGDSRARYLLAPFDLGLWGDR